MVHQHTDSTQGGRLNLAVFHGSVAGILIFLIYAIAFTSHATAFFNAALDWIGNTFGWYYMLVITSYLVFAVGVGISRFGKIRLGPDDSRPEFSLLSWSAMLFAAGIGGAILFFVVSEPLTHYLAPPIGVGGDMEARRGAIVQTFMHWGISGWGVFVVMGMALAYFSYRHRLPLAIRSTLYPLLGKRIYGPIGNAVDIASVVATVFGIATALGIGVMQMNYGLNYLFDVPEGLTTQVMLILLVVTLATLSVVSGVEKGIRRLSELNLLMVAAVVLFVLLQGDTLMLLNALVMNTGDYLAAFVGKSFDTYAYNPEAQSWFSGWTVFFWGFWIAWAPFVGLFLARISRGRTIREFVAGALFIPLTFVMIMISVLGNSGINMVEQGLVVLGEQAVNMPQATIYTLLEQFPWVGLTSSVVVLLSIIFFVTSADSGALVLSNFTYILRDVNHEAPVRLRIFWSVLIGLVTIVLLMVGGFKTLQSAVVISALPFSAIILLSMVGMYRSLKIESDKLDARQQVVTGNGVVLDWRERLDRTLDAGTHDRAEVTIRHAIRPALTELTNELMLRGQKASLIERETEETPLACPMLRVEFDGAPSFIYEIRSRRMQSPSFLSADDYYYLRLDVHLADGCVGQDLNGYTRLQVVHDVLNEYQQHLHFLTLAGVDGNLENIPDHQIEAEITLRGEPA